jgi:DNA helicase-2/ATP-dependent DNA helicase PcrA
MILSHYRISRKMFVPTRISAFLFQSKQIIHEFLRLPDTVAAISAADVHIEASYAASTISKAKAKGISAQEFSKLTAALPNHPDHSTVQRIIAEAYIAYAKELKSSNCLDFDDLLVYGVELLRAHPSVVRDIKHVLVDEL